MQESLDSNKKIVELNHYITEQQIHAKTVVTRIDKMKTIITKLVKLIGDVLLKQSRYINKINAFIKQKVLEGDTILDKTDLIIKNDFKINDLLVTIGKLSTSDNNIEIQLEKFTTILKEIEKKDIFA